MKENRVKLKISTFGINEWIYLVGGNRKSLRYLLDTYIRTHPITSPNGLSYTESGGFLKSLKFNHPTRGIITEKEIPSRRMGDIYLTFFWQTYITNFAGIVRRGTLTRGGVTLNNLLSFQDEDTFHIGLVSVTSFVPI